MPDLPFEAGLLSHLWQKHYCKWVTNNAEGDTYLQLFLHLPPPHTLGWDIGNRFSFTGFLPPPSLITAYSAYIPQSRQSAKLFLKSSELCPPPLRFRGEAHTRWRERGWERPNSDEGTYTVVLLYCICTLWYTPNLCQHQREAKSTQDSSFLFILIFSGGLLM